MKKILSFILLMSLVIIACSDKKKDGGVDVDCTRIGALSYAPASCSQEDMNKFVYQIMTNAYLWADQVSRVDYSAYASTGDLLDDLRRDGWSYITTKESYNAYFEEGKYLGYGFGSKYDGSGDLRINMVYQGSPTQLAGLQRGDRFVEINGLSITDIMDGGLWNQVMGPDEVGTEINLTMEHVDGSVGDYTLVKNWVSINTVLYSDVITQNDSKIGHLVFNKFLETSKDELDGVFTNFKENAVDELILDLRYNGGGRLSIAQHLSSLIAGSNAKEGVFCEYRHNDTYNCWNHGWLFSELPNSLNLKRVFVITTESSCSASETVINSLEPYIDVVVIGEATCGKPVGMYGYDFCDMHIAPIQFQVFNANGDGDYFDGIPPVCQSDDDVTKLFGDPEEDSLKKTLYYIENDQCEAPSQAMGRSKRFSGNGPELEGFRREIGAF